VKTLLAAAPLAVAPGEGNVAKDTQHPGDLAGPAAAAVACAPPYPSLFRASGLAHSPGPPTDLVTLLRRLVI
jgi:hypothetical protein